MFQCLVINSGLVLSPWGIILKRARSSSEKTSKSLKEDALVGEGGSRLEPFFSFSRTRVYRAFHQALDTFLSCQR